MQKACSLGSASVSLNVILVGIATFWVAVRGLAGHVGRVAGGGLGEKYG